MKTIEERAKQAYSIEDGIEGSLYAQDAIDTMQDLQLAYIKGATDQRAIDIEKAYQWLKRNTPIKLMAEEKFEFLEDFKIAMNE